MGQPRVNVFAGKKFGDAVTGDQISKAAQQAVLVAEEGHIDKKQNLVCHLCIRVTSPKANSNEKKSKDWIVEVVIVFENAPSVFIRTNSPFFDELTSARKQVATEIINKSFHVASKLWLPLRRADRKTGRRTATFAEVAALRHSVAVKFQAANIKILWY